MKVVIRADAGSEIGTGHLMRCIALAQALQAKGHCVIFARTGDTQSLSDRLRSESLSCIALQSPRGSVDDAAETIGLARRASATWIVLDGYHFGGSYQSTVKAAGLNLLVVDDKGDLGPYCADIILNQNLHAAERMYEARERGARLLLGPQYALLRREFLAQRVKRWSCPEKPRNVLITLGGSDPHNYTQQVVTAITRDVSFDFSVSVVVGGANRHWESIQATVSSYACVVKTKILRDVQDMSPLMAASDLAICSGGTGALELAFMGVPYLGLSQALQEAMLLQEADKKGICTYLGDFGAVSAEALNNAVHRIADSRATREAMVVRQQTLFDGLGADRIAQAMSDSRMTLQQAIS